MTTAQQELPDVLFKNADCRPEDAQPHLAPYASHAHITKGRAFPEEERPFCSVHRRDCDRIIHSAAFRRLEYKTQVFVNHEGDHFRTRLTHTLEATHIARALCRNLSLNEDLAEAITLAHDLGHTPFGHAGEDALNSAAAGITLFEHNAQSLKILTELEGRYAAFDGLNLTWETIEGLAKHNGPLTGEHAPEGKKPHETILALDEIHHLKLHKFASAEAQIASVADDIAYNTHDIDDGLRAGLFTVADLQNVPMPANIFNEVRDLFPDAPEQRLVYEMTRRMIHRMTVDITRQTLQNIEKYKVRSADDVRDLPVPLVHFSKTMQANVAGVRAFLRERMYEHYRVCRMTHKARHVVKTLFEKFYSEPALMPGNWQARLGDNPGARRKAVTVIDYISGMTDRYARDEYRRIMDPGFRA